jgi:arylsulfatase A-like enzyme
MVYALDENVGRVVDKLEELGLMENTLIIFTSDNGGLTTLEYENWVAPTSVKPLRAGKGWIYEGGIRVPLIIKQPGKDKNMNINTQAMSIDLFPTILDELNLAEKVGQIDGLSLSPVMNGEKGEIHEKLFWHYPHYHASGWKPGSGIRVGDWKLIHFYEDDSYELYNVENDPGEQKDLSIQFPEKVLELQSELKRSMRETLAQEPIPAQ